MKMRGTEALRLLALLLLAQHAAADIFEQFFGGQQGGGGGGQMQRRGRGRGGKRQGQDMQIELAVELAEVYNGGKRNAQMSGKHKVCAKCKGTGAKGGRVVRCKQCEGQGQISRPVQMGPMTVQMQQPCDRCRGKGVTYRKPCKACGGGGIVEDDKALEVVIEPGMDNGMAIPFEGEADVQNPDVLPGDLIFILKVDESKSKFKREGHDLRTHEFVTLKEALLGFDHQLTHMDNRAVMLGHDGITQPFEVRTIPEEGMPIHGSGGAKGNMQVQYRVKWPQRIKANAREALLEAFKGQWPLSKTETHICAAPPCSVSE